MRSLIQTIKTEIEFGGMPHVLAKGIEKTLVDSYRYRIMHRKEDAVCHVKAVGDTQELLSSKEAREKTICYLVHYFYPEKSGGTERFVWQQAKYQQSIGNQVVVICFSKRPLRAFEKNDGRMKFHEYNYQGIPVIAMRPTKVPLGFYYQNIDTHQKDIISFAKKVLHRYQIDLVHCAYGQMFGAFLTACRQEKIPYMLTLTSYDLICHAGTCIRRDGTLCPHSNQGRSCNAYCRELGVMDGRSRYEMAKKILTNAKGIVTPSNYLKEKIEREIKGLNIMVCPHGINKQEYQFQRKSGVKRFACIGAITSWKGYDEAIRAFGRLQGDYELYIVGKGNPLYLARLKKQAKKDKRVRFLAEVTPKQMPLLYKKIDCVIVPSKAPETYHYVLSEAIASGCFVITSDLGAPKERVVEGVSGYCYENGNIDHLTQRMKRVIEMQKSSSKEAEKVQDLEKENNFYARMYQQIIQDK